MEPGPAYPGPSSQGDFGVPAPRDEGPSRGHSMRCFRKKLSFTDMLDGGSESVNGIGVIQAEREYSTLTSPAPTPTAGNSHTDLEVQVQPIPDEDDHVIEELGDGDGEFHRHGRQPSHFKREF